MPCFIRDMGPAHPDEVWVIDDELAVDAMMADPSHGIAREFRARPGETAWDRMRAETPWLDGVNPFHETRLGLGEHNPRIARPLFRAHGDWGIWSPSLHTEPTVVAASQGQARALLRLLERICQTIQPGPKTFAAFGHDIRNLLILACMEAETHWRGVLVANGARRKAFKTTDYVSLVEIMSLRDYAVRFPAFPALDPIRPYETWGLGQNPTVDLPWYAAYNAVKHNREGEFEQANLMHAFQAMSACAVMLVAQYGQGGLGRETDLGAFFHIVEKPAWPIAEVYVANPRAPGTGPTHTRFTSVDHPLLAALQDKPRSVAGA
jgi:hypothetical protein